MKICLVRAELLPEHRETDRRTGMTKLFFALLRKRTTNVSSVCTVRLHHLFLFFLFWLCITAIGHGHKNICSLGDKRCTNQNKLKGVAVAPENHEGI